MYVDSLACFRVKGVESEQFRIDTWVRQGCIISSWLFSVYMDAVMKEGKMGMERRRVRFLEDERIVGESRGPRSCYSCFS